MNKRFVGVLTFAFLVAAGASLVLYRVLITRPPSTKAAPTMVQVALATRNLEPGAVLKEDDVKLSDWPGAVPPGATTDVQKLMKRGVISQIYAKEPVIESRLAPIGAGGGLAAETSAGYHSHASHVQEASALVRLVSTCHHGRCMTLWYIP